MIKQHSNRYRTIDGLRGIAALSVVFYHLSGNLKPELNQLLPEFITVAFSFGYLGVPVFFVISGFVISLSIGSHVITGKYFGNFVLRRSIRLDPTYWVSIIIAIILMAVKTQITGDNIELPSFTSVFLHMFYLQDLLEVSPVISVIYWTLCLEVQLYLFYIISVWLSQKFSNDTKYSKPHIVHNVVILTVGIASLLVDYKIISLSIPGLFISSWHYFLMGVLVSNSIRNLPNSTFILFFWIALELTFQYQVSIEAYSIGGISTTVFIYFLWYRGLLDTVFTSNIFQFMGKISYTLYLIHPDIGWKTISILKSMFGYPIPPLIGGGIGLLGLAASIIAAYILHIAVEKPSLKLCNKLKRP